LTASLAVSRKIALFSLQALEKHFVSQLEITSRDLFYPLLLRWLNFHHPRHRVSLRTREESGGSEEQGRSRAFHAELVPAIGKFIFRHQNRSRERREREISSFSLCVKREFPSLFLFLFGVHLVG